MPKYITVPETARTYQVSINAVRRWIVCGAVAAIKDERGRWQIRRADVDKIMEAKRPAQGGTARG